MISQAARSRLREIFYLDLRSLAVFRIGLGITLICDLIWIRYYFEDFFTDRGVLTKDLANLLNPIPSIFRLFYISENPVYYNSLFAICFISAICFTLGYRHRIAAFVCWFIMCCLIYRNGLSFHSGDALVRVSLFWSIFLPLGQRFSISKETRQLSNRFFSLASVGIIFQMFLVYFIAGLAKRHPIWMETGNAVFYVVNVDYFSSRLGQALRSVAETWTKPLSFATVFFEHTFPFLLFVRLPKELNRILFIACFASLHLFVLVFMDLDVFPWIGFVFLTALIPSTVWNAWGSKATIDPVQFIKQGRLASICIVASLLFVGITNLYLVMARVDQNIGKQIKDVERSLGLMQHWNLFSNPKKLSNDWLLVEGHLKNGDVVDVFRNGGPPLYERPDDIRGSYENMFWIRYLQLFIRQRFTILYNHFPIFLCNRWNENHTGDLQVTKVSARIQREQISKKADAPRKILSGRTVSADCTP